MKKHLYIISLCLIVCTLSVRAQSPQQICVAPTAVGLGNGNGMANACDVSSLPFYLQNH